MDTEAFKAAIESTWSDLPSAKANRYIGKFFDRTLIGKKILAKVIGNHGTYTISIEMKSASLQSACSCYIGKSGFCHHCEALAYTYLNDPESFKVTKQKTLKQVRRLNELETYLKGKTLEALLQELKKQGISQKEFAEAIGMSGRQLSAIKSSELRNRYYNELGATKVACLWVMEHIRK